MKSYTPKKIDPKEDGNFDFAELLVITLAAVLIVMTFFLRHSVVDGSSMDDTLRNGEHLIISSLFYRPARGDIVVFEDYTKGDTLKKPLIKRIIGLPGDTIEIRSDGTILINGTRYTDDHAYIDAPHYRYTPLKYTVSEGHLFVMGDHRNVSLDSRYFGEISEKCILGKLLFRITPLHKFGAVS